MSRICIYLTYNKYRARKKYVEYVLEQLRICVDYLAVICIGRTSCCSQLFRERADKVLKRENKGFDSGGFKDALCEYIGWENISQYDELILVNDSFFGFFYPLEDIFRLMDQTDCDFWGMTGQTEGQFDHPVYRFDAHIHSYFLVFKKNVIRSGAFRDFWDNFVYPKNFREAVVNYEIGINRHLNQNGFKGRSYVDVENIQLKKNENPCYSRTYELIKEYKVPVMKKKCVLIRNIGFQDALKTLAYLEKEQIYPIDLILPYLENQFYIPGMGEEVCNSLETFYRLHAEIYIYGAGVCGRNLDVYFDYKDWKHKGFIVTSASDTEQSARCIKDVKIHSDTGIIISVLNAEVAKEIAENLGDRCKREQLFFISDCSAIKLPE